MSRYVGKIVDGKALVFKDGEPFSNAESLKIINHSPSGFAWGYWGSGPAQLALALLLDCTKDKKVAQSLYQYFKEDVIAKFPMEEDWTLVTQSIELYVQDMKTRVRMTRSEFMASQVRDISKTGEIHG